MECSGDSQLGSCRNARLGVIRFTWTWNKVTESSSMRTLTPTSFPAFFGVPGGVLLLAPQSAGLPLTLRESIWELRASEPSLFIVPSAILPHCQAWRATASSAQWCQHWQITTKRCPRESFAAKSWRPETENIVGCYYSKQKQATRHDIYIYMKISNIFLSYPNTAEICDCSVWYSQISQSRSKLTVALLCLNCPGVTRARRVNDSPAIKCLLIYHDHIWSCTQ